MVVGCKGRDREAFRDGDDVAQVRGEEGAWWSSWRHACREQEEEEELGSVAACGGR